MNQIRENVTELRETIRKYGEMPVNPERANFLANCWAAYKALCMICGGEEADMADNDGDEMPLTKEQAMCWVAAMENADGTHGGHWTMEQTEQVRKQKSLTCDPVTFYAAMNMMYSDYCKVAEKFNAAGPEFFACMAKAFLEDKDAMPNKLARYYHGIAASGEHK